VKFLLSVFRFLALVLVATIEFTASAQSSESPLSKIVSDSTPIAIGSEVPKERLPQNWSDADVFGLRTFAEPLVAQSRVASEEECIAFFAGN